MPVLALLLKLLNQLTLKTGVPVPQLRLTRLCHEPPLMFTLSKPGDGKSYV